MSTGALSATGTDKKLKYGGTTGRYRGINLLEDEEENLLLMRSRSIHGLRDIQLRTNQENEKGNKRNIYSFASINNSHYFSIILKYKSTLLSFSQSS